MAGYNLPKKPENRARRNKDPRADSAKVLPLVVAEQPSLPDRPRDRPWPQRTRDWWQMWSESPLSRDFTEADWSELLDAALLHPRLWDGETAVAAELRLRVAKFGATPEDRARLRITFAAADEADEKRGTRQSSRARYDGLSLAT